MSAPLPRWSIDPVHSTIGYQVAHMGFSLYRGRFNGVEGTVLLDPSDLGTAQVEAKVDTRTVVAVGDGLYKALIGKDFLQSDQHPHLSFKSTGVETGADHSTLQGELTLRGVTRPVSLQVTSLGEAKNPFAQKQMLGFRAEGEIDRGDFGIVWNVPLENGGKYLGEKVRIVLNIELLRQA
ncbi:MAG: YceI family protein [Myxococcota bacterium]|nr:YceI family protein [Myxococcota bacterium]